MNVWGHRGKKERERESTRSTTEAVRDGQMGRKQVCNLPPENTLLPHALRTESPCVSNIAESEIHGFAVLFGSTIEKEFAFSFHYVFKSCGSISSCSHSDRGQVVRTRMFR
jgi:hypothetical protein